MGQNPPWQTQQSKQIEAEAGKQSRAGRDVGREGEALTGEREDAGLGEPAELLEDAAAFGNADGEGHLLPARPRRGHRRRARTPQLGVVRARVRHLLQSEGDGDGDGREAVGKERKVGGGGSVTVASAHGVVVQVSNFSVGFTFYRGWRRAGDVPDPALGSVDSRWNRVRMESLLDSVKTQGPIWKFGKR
jgi:hypothetical protein